MSTISKEIKNYYSIVYQITQECPFTCDICLRYYKIGDSSLSPEERIHMVDILKKHNVGSITVTGGEPTILKDNLFSFLKHVHKKRIHTCLSTTGFRLEHIIKLVLNLKIINLNRLALVLAKLFQIISEISGLVHGQIDKTFQGLW